MNKIKAKTRPICGPKHLCASDNTRSQACGCYQLRMLQPQIDAVAEVVF